MKQSSYTTRILEPNDGFVLTQSKDVDILQRIFSKKVFLAVNANPEDWKEVTEKEADELKKEQEESTEKERREREN